METESPILQPSARFVNARRDGASRLLGRRNHGQRTSVTPVTARQLRVRETQFVNMVREHVTLLAVSRSTRGSGGRGSRRLLRFYRATSSRTDSTSNVGCWWPQLVLRRSSASEAERSFGGDLLSGSTTQTPQTCCLMFDQHEIFLFAASGRWYLSSNP